MLIELPDPLGSNDTAQLILPNKERVVLTRRPDQGDGWFLPEPMAMQEGELYTFVIETGLTHDEYRFRADETCIATHIAFRHPGTAESARAVSGG